MAVVKEPSVKRAFFRPRRIGHANLFVGQLERSMDFYYRVVGLEETYRRPPVRAGFHSNGNTHHDVGLVEVGGPLGQGKIPGLNHFGWELENEVDLVEGYFRAVDAGVKFARTVDHEIARSVYLRDGDGNMNEIYADTTKNWRTERTGQVMNPTVQWAPGQGPTPSPESKYHPNPEIRRVEEAAFHPIRVTHAVLVAQDYEGVVQAYTDVVGLTPTLGGIDQAFTLLSGTCGQRDLGVFRARPGRPAGLHHVGFLVADESDLDEAERRLRRAGIRPEIQIDHATRRSIFVRDPDGIRLEFYVDRGAPATQLAEIEDGLTLFLA
jgi:catechol 2,3-dioxygenase